MLSVLLFLSATSLSRSGEASQAVTASWYDSNSIYKEGTCREKKCYTASGKEIHDLEKHGVLWIASNRIKLKSKVRVCDAHGKRCSEAFVYDKGGFEKYGREADLCRALFARFAPTSQGITKVKITKLRGVR